MAVRITHADLLAMIAAVYTYVLPQVPDASAAQLLLRSQYAAPALRGEQIVQQDSDQEFKMVQQFGNGFAILTPPEWIDISQLRTSTQAKAKTPRARRYRRSRHRSRCLSTSNISRRLFPALSYFRSWPGSLVRCSPVLQLARHRDWGLMREDCRAPFSV